MGHCSRTSRYGLAERAWKFPGRDKLIEDTPSARETASGCLPGAVFSCIEETAEIYHKSISRHHQRTRARISAPWMDCGAFFLSAPKARISTINQLVDTVGNQGAASRVSSCGAVLTKQQKSTIIYLLDPFGNQGAVLGSLFPSICS